MNGYSRPRTDIRQIREKSFKRPLSFGNLPSSDTPRSGSPLGIAYDRQKNRIFAPRALRSSNKVFVLLIDEAPIQQESHGRRLVPSLLWRRP